MAMSSSDHGAHRRRTLGRSTLLALILTSGAVQTEPKHVSFDPAARGLDVFVHAPSEAIAGSTLPLQVEAIGFPNITQPSALAGAEIEASWNPQALAKMGRQALAPVKARTDANGLAHLDLAVPPTPGEFPLLVAVRSGDHERVRELTMAVHESLGLSLFVSDRLVVPGSTVLAWALARRVDTELPVAGSRVEFRLSEGDAVRARVETTTGATGVAAARFGIPPVEAPGLSWHLSVRSMGGRTQARDSVELRPRDETPGLPRLDATWDDPKAGPGGTAAFTVTVVDGAGDPLGNLPIRYRVGPQGLVAPRDADARGDGDAKAESDDFATEAMSGSTDAAGVFHGKVALPSVVPANGLEMVAQVRATVFGHELREDATFTVHPTRGVLGQEERNDLNLSIVPEFNTMVPGFEHRLVLSASDDKGPVADEFALDGDGLSVRVKTGEHGYGEFSWTVPKGAGAHQTGGDCSAEVAASVRVRRLSRPGHEQRLCLGVDPDASAVVHVGPPLLRSGEAVTVRIEGKVDQGVSILGRSRDGHRSVSRWFGAHTKTGQLTLPHDASGIWTFSAVVPGRKEAAKLVPESAVLVVPKRLPKLIATRTGGRLVPSGFVNVDAELRDGIGKPMPGTVAALILDDRGGADPLDLTRLDTRNALGDGLEHGDSLDAFLESPDPQYDPVRRAALGADRRTQDSAAVVFDPSAMVVEGLQKAFESVVHAVEGAVHEATEDPDRLRDVRRRGPKGWEFNPEIEEVIRTALSDEIQAPGGEPLNLPDLVAMDRQVDFDHVARRVARHKLFRALTKVRAYVREHRLDREEPVLRDPNAMLRRLIKNGAIEAHDLLDPWGGTLHFVPDAGPRIPFLSVVPGYALHAPGPDGRLGTADDVRDPFARVLRSKSPYAEAVREDDIVDAKWDMEIGDTTVDAWTALFDATIGDQIGDAFGAGGLGLTGTGEGGGGTGQGTGLGSMRTVGHGHTRKTSEFAGYTHWLDPVRTDDHGHVALTVPLGPNETTWRIWLIGLPDGGSPATTSLAVPVTLSVSARVDAGSVWSQGDRAEAVVTVRNRTDHPIRSTVKAEPKACLALETAQAANQMVLVPAGGAKAVSVPLRATQAGNAQLSITLRTPGHEDDILTHEWRIRPAGERVDVANAVWVQKRSRISLPLEASVEPTGPMRLVLEHGLTGMLGPVLDSLDPDRQRTLPSLADAVEVAERIRRFSILHTGEHDPLTKRAADLLERAAGRLFAYGTTDDKLEGRTRALALARLWLPALSLTQGSEDAAPRKPPAVASTDSCPDDAPGSVLARANWLETAPMSTTGAGFPCWDAFISTTLQKLNEHPNPVAIATTVLALADHAERRTEVEALVGKLRELVSMRPTGEIVLPAPFQGDPEARTVVLAALLRTADYLPGIAAPPIQISSWLAVQRDAAGGFGSSAATRLAVRALLPLANPEAHPATVTVIARGKNGLATPPAVVRIGAMQSTRIPLDPATTEVDVETDVPGILARLERPVVRRWQATPVRSGSPLRLEVVWPEHLQANSSGTLRVSLLQQLERSAMVEVRIPLPPGVRMSEPAGGIRQSNGTILIRTKVEPSLVPTLVTVPIRSGIPGQLTAPEASAYVVDQEVVRAYAPARSIKVER